MDEISIKVTLTDRQYPLKINSEEEETVRKAAKLINEKARSYEKAFSVKDKQDALSMAALEITIDSLSEKTKEEKKDKRILQTLNEIDSLLNKALQL